MSNESKSSYSLADNLGRWFTTKILKIPAHIYDVSGKTNVSIGGIIKKVGLALGVSAQSAKDFSSPDFDLQQIQSAYEADGYVRGAVDKYVDLIFKSGWQITGTNPKAVEYIKTRFMYMAEVTGIPTDVLFSEIGESFVKFNNVIIGKARTQDKNTLPPKNQIKGMDGLDPIGGYYILPIQTIQVKRDKNGIVKGWQQLVDGQDKPAKFKVEDIIHMYYKREPGKAFAYPSLLAVLDDVRALREIEERVLHMIFRHVNPLIHTKVGNKESPGTANEVETVRSEIENMSIEGGIVTTDKVTMDTINTRNTLAVEVYLAYFEKRVFTGLNVSETMMGRGATSNRSTSDNQKEEAVDRVKAFQKIIRVFINNSIVNELLKEGGFDPLNNLNDVVEFGFKDPDMDSKIKQEAHAVFKYQNNAITENEMRNEMGKDPIVDADRKLLWFPQYSKSTNMQASNTIQPENQSGKKTSPKKTTNSLEEINNSLLDNIFLFVENIYNNNDNIENYIKDINNFVAISENNTIISVIDKFGIDKYNKSRNNISSMFKSLYDNILDTISELQTINITKITISAIVDIFNTELNIILNELGEEE